MPTAFFPVYSALIYAFCARLILRARHAHHDQYYILKGLPLII